MVLLDDTAKDPIANVLAEMLLFQEMEDNGINMTKTTLEYA